MSKANSISPRPRVLVVDDNVDASAQSWIALTGYGQAEDSRRAQEVGFDYYLIKPVDLISLPDLLTEWIDRKKAGATLE